MEATKIKMNMDGTFRAKVLQYKSDGNTLTEKWETLTKYTEGIYYSYSNIDNYGHRSINIIFAKNGVYWRKTGAPEYYFNPGSFRYAENMENLKRMYADYEADILQAATNGGWLNKLHITVMERLGHDVAPLLVAYEERKRKRQEEERKRIEAAEKAEQERVEAEERRKAEVLADGKEKLLKHESITVEQIELIAEAVGYKIHIRTIGFMREKVTEVVMLDNDRVQVFGYKLTSRNIDGTAKVMHELYNCLKAQAEEELEQSATPTETPQISTETAETVNVSAEGEKRAKTGSNKAVEKAKTWLCPNNTFDIQPYGKNKALYISVDMDTPPRYHVMVAFWEKNSRYEGGKRFTNRQIDIDGKECYFDGSSFPTLQAAREFAARLLSEPPQSPEAPQAAECTGGTPKLRETAEIAITSITQLNVLKYKLQHPKLKEWAVKYGLLDLVRNMYCAPELSLGGLWIDNKFRQSLCENDKSIIAAVRKLIAKAEKVA